VKRVAAIALLPLALAAFAPQQPDDRAPLSTAEKKQLSVEIIVAVKAQLMENHCWADHSDMPEARRLSVTIRIWLGPDGHFRAPPQLVNPEQEPLNDRPMQVFLAHARRALDVCNIIGWKLPDRSAELLPENYIDLMFVPKVGTTP
jgi:hypothetical protein